jgi:hypothetical protein
MERTSEELNRKAFGLEFVKRATRMSSGLRKMRNWNLRGGCPPLEWKIKNWTLGRGRPPPKWKKNLLAALV